MAGSFLYLGVTQIQYWWRHLWACYRVLGGSLWHFGHMATLKSQAVWRLSWHLEGRAM